MCCVSSFGALGSLLFFLFYTTNIFSLALSCSQCFTTNVVKCFSDLLDVAMFLVTHLKRSKETFIQYFSRFCFLLVLLHFYLHIFFIVFHLLFVSFSLMCIFLFFLLRFIFFLFVHRWHCWRVCCCFVLNPIIFYKLL